MTNGTFEYKVVNIVASTDLNKKLDLFHVNVNLENCIYEPDVYYALIYRLKNPKLTILVNKSGKLIFTGAKSIEDINIALNIFNKKLVKIGYKTIISKIKIHNLVILSDFGMTLNLHSLASILENSEYEPEQFTGLIYRLGEPKVVLFLFGTGKILCMGAKSFEDALIGIEKTKKLVMD